MHFRRYCFLLIKHEKRIEKPHADPELTRRIQELIKFKGGGYNEHEVADIIENGLKLL